MLKDVAPHVRETEVKLPSVGDEMIGSINYPLQFLGCGHQRTSQQADALKPTRLVMKTWTKMTTVSSSSDRSIRRR